MSDASELIASAERVEAACDLEVGLPARATELAHAVAAALGEGDVAQASPRALWNLLWLAADLTAHVDIYRAVEIWGSVERLFVRHFAGALDGPGEAAEAAEMTFDFFFNRPRQPLVQLRFGEVLATLERLLALPNRFCRRAALHGLGHLRQLVDAEARARVDGALDGFLAAAPDAALAEYARTARDGAML